MTKYTLHAKIRMEERKISRREASNVLKHPEQIWRSFDNTFVANKKLNSKILGVVFIKENKKTFKIITCYWK